MADAPKCDLCGLALDPTACFYLCEVGVADWYLCGWACLSNKVYNLKSDLAARGVQQ
jgi:sulfur transfer complex TusBCD TusB component (DsrH family)